MRLSPEHLSYSCCSPSPVVIILSNDILVSELSQTSRWLQLKEKQQEWAAAKSDMTFSWTSDVWDGWWGLCRMLYVLKALRDMKIIIKCVKGFKMLEYSQKFYFCHVVPLLCIPVIQKMTIRMLPCVFKLSCAASPTVMNLPTHSLPHSENTKMKC